MISIPRLEPKDLYDRRVRRDHARLRAYNTLLEQIFHRIYATSQLPGNTSSVLYSVPPFILGLPKLDMEDCIVYLVWQLRESKFEVRFTWPNLLWISWRHHEGEYLTKKNPIIQAMMPEKKPPANANANAKKGQAPAYKPPVSFNHEIELITSVNTRANSSYSDFGIPQGQGQRRAMDYQPPDSFIQNLEKPGPGREQKSKGNVLADLWS